jgi:23S rRNA (uracil1939-C5)-methyltransferase
MTRLSSARQPNSSAAVTARRFTSEAAGVAAPRPCRGIVKLPVKAQPRSCQVRIDRVGAEGDGVGCASNEAPVYVPFTLPGELVTASLRRARGEGWLARCVSIDHPSSARIDPPCEYFGRCGGCALQHWRDRDYAEWKRWLLVSALQRAGCTTPEPVALISGSPGERRRLDFAVRRDRGHIVLGLHMANSGVVVDLTHCIVLHPVLMSLMAALRGVLQRMQAIRREASVVINLLDNGPDVLLRTDAALPLDDRTALIEFARSSDVPRISWTTGNAMAEPVCIFRPPARTLAGVEVRPPPGAFLQPTTAGERAIVEAVLAGLPTRMAAGAPRTRIAELFAGCGTLTFALAEKARVVAWEGDAASAAALSEAAKRAGPAGRVEVLRRDLARQPLSAKELAGFPVVVLDPPHAGAAAQIAQVAASGAATIVYVSCNPSSLARDARTLRTAGYTLAKATAIDQFLWSARLESVCVFRRP